MKLKSDFGSLQGALDQRNRCERTGSTRRSSKASTISQTMFWMLLKIRPHSTNQHHRASPLIPVAAIVRTNEGQKGKKKTWETGEHVRRGVKNSKAPLVKLRANNSSWKMIQVTSWNLPWYSWSIRLLPTRLTTCKSIVRPRVPAIILRKKTGQGIKSAST